MPATPQPRLVARLRSPDLLRDAMDYNDLNIRELSERCGSMRHRATIGHLHSGARDVCTWHLAGRIERVLRMPKHSLFALEVSNPNVVSTAKIGRAA